MNRSSWQCLYCRHYATIDDANRTTELVRSGMISAEGSPVFIVDFIVCPNEKCKKYTLSCMLHLTKNTTDVLTVHTFKKSWQLIPQSSAEAFPGYVPEGIRADYEEACLIQELSPKSAATLARRCLQGIVRDFWNAKGNTLYEEIESIKEKIDPEILDAIEAVRKVGNIGAHMEKEPGLIIDIDPNEANALIKLIETLIKETYIAREKRKARMESVKQIASGKEAQRKDMEGKDE